MEMKEKRGYLLFRYLRFRKISITRIVRLATNLDADVGDAGEGRKRELITLIEISLHLAHGGNGLDLGVRTAIPLRISGEITRGRGTHLLREME